MNDLGLQSPWITYTNKVREMFKRDPEIRMTWSDETNELKMFVANQQKADALAELLPATKNWGRKSIKITIIPANENENEFGTVSGYTIHDAFEGNPIYSYTKVFKDSSLGQNLCYVVFKKEVIQWWNDDLNDLFGNSNMLAEDMAREIFEDCRHIFFCTDVE